METWNFRIVHVAGALILGFVLYSARAFPDDGERWPYAAIRSTIAAWAAALPALYACWTALGFAGQIAGGEMWNGVVPRGHQGRRDLPFRHSPHRSRPPPPS